MNRNLSCNIHSNYPIYHIDILENSQKKLQCIKCVSYQQEEKSFLLIPEILNYDQKLLLQNWPPLNDETLRNKIISLENQENDLNQPIQDFYDGLIKDLTLILSEKKKEQLILAQKAHKLKSESEFLIGIISDSCNKKHFPDDWIASDIIGNQDVSQGDQILNEENLIQTWQFQVCIKDKTFNMYNYPNFTLRFYLEEQSDIQVDGKYYFGVLFLSDYPGDKLEIFDYQELDEFPDS